MATFGAKQNFSGNPEYMKPHWEENIVQGQPRQSDNFWGSGLGGMPEHTSGFGAPAYSKPYASNMNNNSTPSTPNVLSGGNPGGSFVENLNNANLFSDMQNLRRSGPESSTFDPSTLGGPNNPMHQGMFSKGLESLGGWGALANLGIAGYGLYQNSQQIGDLRDWRSKLNERADASLAMDREKFGLVKQEYDTRNTKRQADMWKQRDPNLRTNPSDNPYMSKLLPQEA